MDNINYILGQEIKKIREYKSLSHECIAESCNLSVSHLKNIENGNRGLTVDLLELILSALEVDEMLFFSKLKDKK